VILVSLVVLLGILMMVLRQRKHYHRALIRTYERLLDDYRRQRDEQDLEPSNPNRHVQSSLAANGSALEEDDELMDPSDTGITEEATVEDIQCYDQFMNILLQEKLHLNHRFKVEDVARRLDITARRLTQITRKMSGCSFTQLLNRHRVEEVSRIMEDEHSAHLKIGAIAGMCGFSNGQHFRRVFEQVTGVYPGFYRSRTLPGSDALDLY